MAIKLLAKEGVEVGGTVADSVTSATAFSLTYFGAPGGETPDNPATSYADFGYSRDPAIIGMGHPVELTAYGICETGGADGCAFTTNVAAANGLTLSRYGIYGVELYNSAYSWTAYVYQPVLTDGRHVFTLLRTSPVASVTMSGPDETLTLTNTGGQAAIPAGAMVILQTTCLSELPANADGVGDPVDAWSNVTPDGFFASNGGAITGDAGFEFIAWTGGDAAPAAVDGQSEYFIRVTDPGASGRYFNRVMSAGIHTGPGDANASEFYPGFTVDETYQIELIVRADVAGDATLEFQGFDLRTVDSGTSSGTDETTLALTTAWQTFTFDLVYEGHAASGLQNGRLKRVDALDVDFARVRFKHKTAPIGDLPVNVMASIPSGGDIAYRDHSNVKDHVEKPSMDGMTNTAEFSSRRNSIANQLFFCKRLGLIPHIQFDWNRDPAGFQDLVAYLGATVGSGHAMALKRDAQGQTAPWTDEFTKIIIEPSNEMWQGGGNDFAGAHGTYGWSTTLIDDQAGALSRGESYAMIAEWVITQMKASAHWSALEPIAEFHLGGQRGNTSEIADMVQNNPSAEFMTISAYIGGLDTGGTDVWQDTGARYEALGAYWDGSMKADVAAYVAECVTNGVTSGAYEWGSGSQNNSTYSAPNVGGTEEELATSSVMMGTAELNTLFGGAAAGHRRSAYFTLNEGSDFSANVHPRNGGGTRPGWQMIKAIWDELGVCMIKDVSASLSNTANRAAADIKLLEAYALYSRADVTKGCVVVLNRGIDPSLLDGADPDYSATPADNVTTLTLTLPQATYAVRKTMGTHALQFNNHNRWTPGNRKNSDWSGFDADTRCVAIDLSFGADEGAGVASTLNIGAINAGTAKVILLDGLA